MRSSGKWLLFLFVAFWGQNATAQADVYYCAELDSNGFKLKSGTYEKQGFKVDRFKARIDFDKKSFFSNDLQLNDETCERLFNIGMSCHDSGYTIHLNKENLRFTLSQSYGFVGGDKDTISTGYGMCERF